MAAADEVPMETMSAALERIAASSERKARLWRNWLWFVIFPALGVVMYFCWLQPQYAHQQHHHGHPPAFSCASLNASLANIGAGGQIAPLCGNTPYPADPNPDSGLGADYNPGG